MPDLLKCPGCSKEIHKEAKACPECGYPLADKLNKKATERGCTGCLVIIIAVVLIVYFSASYESSSTYTGSSSTSPSTAAKTQRSVPQKKHGLTIKQRKAVYYQISDKIQDARIRAEKKYPSAPHEHLRKGKAYTLKKATNLMPNAFVSPQDQSALGWAENVYRLEEGKSFKILQKKNNRNGGNPWYKVKAGNKTGWLNSTSLWGIASQQLDKWGEYQEKEETRIIKRLAKINKLSVEAIKQINIEGASNHWPSAPYRNK